MVKRLALISSLFFNNSETAGGRCLSSSTSMSAASFSTAASWQWPSCTQPRTLSFRRDSPEIVSMRQDQDSKQQHEEEEEEEGYKTTMNPGYGLDNDISLSTAPAVVADDEDEVIIQGLRSSNTRLFFEPETTSSSIIMKKKKQEKQRTGGTAAFGGATALAIESGDPYGDFRRSMEEMVLSHGVDDWGWLEEMLSWYLRANGKNTHGLIVGAFVDLLVALASSSSAASPACSASSFRHPHHQPAKNRVTTSALGQ